MIKLTEEKETMLIPLYGKAMDYQSDTSILNDLKADEIVRNIDFPFGTLKIDQKTNIMMTLRAKLIDDYASKFINTKEAVMTLHLGCGLDSRCVRISDVGHRWIDVDYTEVIDIRREFYAETESSTMIGTSVTDEEWLEKIPVHNGECLVVAEGLFMYLSEEEIKGLLSRLKDKFGSYTIIFDAYSKMTAKHAGNHPSLKRTGAVIKWGMDKSSEFERLIVGASYVETLYLTDNHYTKDLAKGTRIAYRIANAFKMAKEAHRILVYRVKEG